MHKLIIEDDEGRTTVVPLIREEMTIGRREGNTIRLTEKNISRRHARLLTRNGSVLIEDLTSYNGVKVNGARIKAATSIREGDIVLLGDYKFSIKADRPSAPAPAAQAPASRSTAPQVLAAPAGAQAQAAAPAPAPAAPLSPAAVLAAAAALPQMDGAPTIPIRTLAAQGLANPETGALLPPSRLVVLNTEFRGAEFVLDRASLVIGRTEENDFVINHRSISRHHSKIVRDGSRYTIVDLESANGVRVNGEEYERVELHPGDSVELGHVRLRFLAHDDVFTPDQLGAEGGRRYVKPVLFGAGLITAGVIGAVFLLRPSPRAVVDVASGSSAAAGTTATSPAAPEPTPPAPSVDELVARVAAARKAENWSAAQNAMNQLAAHYPGDQRIAGMKQQLEDERATADALAALKLAYEQRNDDQVVQLYDAMADGPYKDQARELYDKSRAHAVAFHLETAERLRAQGKCVDAAQEAKVVLSLEPENQLVRQLVKMCKPARGELAAKPLPEPVAKHAVAAAEPPPVAKRSAATASPAPEPRRPIAADKPAAPVAKKASVPVAASVAATPEPAEPAADTEALLKQARDAWLHQRCPAAIELAKKAQKAAGGGLDEAYKIIAVCSCSLSDSDGAARAYGKLSDKDQQMVKSLCAKRGVKLD